MASVILYVDDEPVAAALVDELDRRGHELVRTQDPEEVLRLVASGEPVLVFLEPLLSGCDGFELLPTGRYGHAPALIERLAAENGFELTARNDGPLRREGDTSLPGLYMLLGRQP